MSTSKIWDKILSPGEEIKFEFSLGNRYVNVAKYALIILGIPLLFLYGLGVIFIIGGFVWGWYLKRANNYAFTNKRVLVLKGWLSTHLTSVDYDKITIFKESVKKFVSSPEEIKELVKNIVWHEVAHHFGFDEKEVRELERKRKLK